MESIEIMTVAITVGMTIIPSMKARFRKEFYRVTKHSVLALLVVLTGILIFEFSHNASVQALMVALMGIASAVEFCIAGTNAIETIGDKLAIHENGETTILTRENIAHYYERDNKILVIEGQGRTVKLLTSGCERLEEWLGIQR